MEANDIIQSPIWLNVLGALRQYRPSESMDKMLIRGDACFLLPQKNTLTARADRSFVEAHRQFIDVQCCYTGSEYIECPPDPNHQTLQIKAGHNYDPKKDYIGFEIPKEDSGGVTLLPGNYTIFPPYHPHLPGIRHQDEITEKVVVKISRSLIQENSPNFLSGPYRIPIDYSKSAEEMFRETTPDNLYDLVDDQMINPTNYPITHGLTGTVWREIYLAHLNEIVSTDKVIPSLTCFGLNSTPPEGLLYLGLRFPELMDHYPITTLSQLPVFGRAGRAAMCLHTHNGFRRLRRHAAEPPWNAPMRFAVEMKLF